MYRLKREPALQNGLKAHDAAVFVEFPIDDDELAALQTCGPLVHLAESGGDTRDVARRVTQEIDTIDRVRQDLLERYEAGTAPRATLGDLEQRFPVVTRQLQMECGGNGRSFFSPEARGNQWGNGAAGCAEWSGVRLRDVGGAREDRLRRREGRSPVRCSRATSTSCRRSRAGGHSEARCRRTASPLPPPIVQSRPRDAER